MFRTGSSGSFQDSETVRGLTQSDSHRACECWAGRGILQFSRSKMHTPDHPVSRDSGLIVHTRSTGGKKKATNPRRLFSAVESLPESLYRGNNPTKPCLVDTKGHQG